MDRGTIIGLRDRDPTEKSVNASVMHAANMDIKPKIVMKGLDLREQIRRK